MYISFRFYRSSMKHEYNLKGDSHPREYINIQPLWGIHQSEINGNAHFSLGVSPSRATDLFIVNFLQLILP